MSQTKQLSDSIDTLRKYKTAYSFVFKKYVGITRVYADIDGMPIIQAYLEGDPDKKGLLFRPYELKDYVL